MRYNTTWQQIEAYDKSSREIFLAITDAIHAGGWPSLFSNMTLHGLISKYLRGEFIISLPSLQKLARAMQYLLAKEPVPTHINAQETRHRFKTLLIQINTALRVERALLEMQKDIDDFNQVQQQHIRQAIAIRDAHLLPNRFRISWDDVQAYTTSSVSVIEELLAELYISLNEVSRHAAFGHSVLSDHLRGLKNMRDNIATEASHAFCRIITTADLPAARAAKLCAKAINLPKLIRVEKAAREILPDRELNKLLTYEQKEMLKKVQNLKEEALRARARAKTTQSR